MTLALLCSDLQQVQKKRKPVRFNRQAFIGSEVFSRKSELD